MQHPPGPSADFYQIDRVAATTQQKGSLKRVSQTFVATNQQEGSLKAKVANLLGGFT